MARKRYVSTILEWIQCFGIYMAVLMQKHPEHIPDLSGYQHLIITASLEYDSDNWLGYTDNSVLLCSSYSKHNLGARQPNIVEFSIFYKGKNHPLPCSTALVSTIKLLNVNGPQSTQCQTHQYNQLELCDTIDTTQYRNTKWVLNYSKLWYRWYRLCNIAK